MNGLEDGGEGHGEMADLDTLIQRLPTNCTTTARTTPQCCCGRTDCVHLKHNGVALDDLEKEVRTAAQLGQVSILRPTFVLDLWLVVHAVTWLLLLGSCYISNL